MSLIKKLLVIVSLTFFLSVNYVTDNYVVIKSYAQTAPSDQANQDAILNLLQQRNQQQQAQQTQQQKEVEQQNAKKAEQLQSTLDGIYNIMRVIFVINGFSAIILLVFLITGILAMIKYLRVPVKGS